MRDVTLILQDLEKRSEASPCAAEELLPLVYDELRRLARSRLAQETPGQTLQATALVHEAFLRLVGTEAPNSVWDNRGHFFAAAAEAMRRILVDAARKRNALKRGGGLSAADADIDTIASPINDEDLLAVHDVLDRLCQVDSDAAMLVKLRFFAGMNMSEVAGAMQISLRTAHNVWAYARAWLRNELGR